jgi:hypothetical protein
VQISRECLHGSGIWLGVADERGGEYIPSKLNIFAVNPIKKAKNGQKNPKIAKCKDFMVY